MKVSILGAVMLATALLALVGVGANWLYNSTRDSHFAAGRNNGANAENIRVIQTLRREMGDIPDCAPFSEDQMIVKLASSKTSAIYITRTDAGTGFCQYE